MMKKKILRCDHRCQLDDLKNTFEQHCEEMDECLNYSIDKFCNLAEFLTDEIVPYLEYCAFQVGDQQAHDLIIDLHRRIALT
jgi:hypothetical protein